MAWVWVDNPSCDYFTCWQIRVLSRDGCPDGVYAELNILSGDTVIGYTNDSLGYLGPGETALLTLTDTNENSTSGRLTDLTCY